MTDDTYRSSAAFDRYIAIIDLFAGLHDGGIELEVPSRHVAGRIMGVLDVSRELDISKGTISRYLRRLESSGILTRRPDRRYQLSSRVFHWGQAAIPGMDLRPVARPVMERLAARFGEPVSLFVLDAGLAVCVDRVESVHPIRINVEVGQRLPLHIGSSPRLILAYSSSQLQEEVLARAPFAAMTPDTITGADALREANAETRRQGYVVSLGESNAGVVGIAAPVLDAAGKLIASVSLAAPADRVAGERREECLAAVLDAAAEVSRAMGRPADGAERTLSGVVR